ncbi:hypothetical protein RFI_34795, partial [Reticulomyxa filosa]
MLGQNTPHGIESIIRSNGKTDMLTKLPNMYATSELSNASMYGGIGSAYGVGNGIGYGIDMHDTKNKQAKMTSNNDMDVDTSGTRRIDFFFFFAWKNVIIELTTRQNI